MLHEQTADTLICVWYTGWSPNTRSPYFRKLLLPSNERVVFKVCSWACICSCSCTLYWPDHAHRNSPCVKITCFLILFLPDSITKWGHDCICSQDFLLFLFYCGIFTPCKNPNLKTRSRYYMT
jgi:hypothetical protein